MGEREAHEGSLFLQGMEGVHRGKRQGMEGVLLEKVHLLEMEAVRGTDVVLGKGVIMDKLASLVQDRGVNLAFRGREATLEGITSVIQDKFPVQ